MRASGMRAKGSKGQSEACAIFQLVGCPSPSTTSWPIENHTANKLLATRQPMPLLKARIATYDRLARAVLIGATVVKLLCSLLLPLSESRNYISFFRCSSV